MLDLLFMALAVRAFIASAAQRFVVGCFVAAFGAGAFVLVAASGYFGRLFDGMDAAGVLLLVVFGPSSLPGRTPRVPLSAEIAKHPVLVKAVIGAAFGAPYLSLTRKANAHPLRESSSDEHRLALRFLAPAMVAVAMPFVLALAEALTPTP